MQNMKKEETIQILTKVTHKIIPKHYPVIVDVELYLEMKQYIL
jgi:hypothetical protein